MIFSNIKYLSASVYYLNMPVILIISKNNQLNGLPCSRVDLILLNTALFHQMAHNAHTADQKALGICIGVLICGAIVNSEKCGRIQPFQIQYTIHNMDNYGQLVILI